MLSLALRDLNGVATLDEVLGTISGFADYAISTAVEAHSAALVETHGAPAAAASFVVVGMGKLGGHELNVSSDIDLVFAYDKAGETLGPSSLEHQAFFERLGRRVITTLNQVTADGFVFRVDMRLRPFGDSGPLVASFASLDEYFQSQARAWERYAWSKARVICGAPAAARDLMSVVTPFVYRRYADYRLIEALRELAHRIRAHHGTAEDDIKIGPGGIRELEFFVQAQQLIHGGKNEQLRTASTRTLIARLATAGLLDQAIAHQLQTSYAFLRNLEHRIQYLNDEQTQALPTNTDDQARLAKAMNATNYAALLDTLDTHRRFVRTCFDRVVNDNPAERRSAMADLLAPGPEAPAAEAIGAAMAEDGASALSALAPQLAQWTRGTRWLRLSEIAQRRLGGLIAATCRICSPLEHGELAAIRIIALLEAVDRREAYLAMLTERTELLPRLADLFVRSGWIAQTVTRHPLLLDDVLKPDRAVDWAVERSTLEQTLASRTSDEEAQLNALRDFKLGHTLRLAIDTLEGRLPVMALSDELAVLADLLIDVTLTLAAERMGKPGLREHFAVIAYGKLGGKELGFGSDLDLVYLYDQQREPQADQLARLAQRLNTMLSATTTSGKLYEVDLRLRPDGASGMMVTSLAAFAAYQHDRAWLWEHQALTRARAVAGSRDVGQQFEAIRRVVLAAPRDAIATKRQILAMRERMRDEHKGKRYERDVKHTTGGMIDIEFCVQTLVLLHTREHAVLAQNLGNRNLLAICGSLDLIDAGIAEGAAHAYLAFRHLQHEAALDDRPSDLPNNTDMLTERDAVRALWRVIFADLQPAEALGRIGDNSR